jgi:hypothetical protein
MQLAKLLAESINRQSVANLKALLVRHELAWVNV